MLQKLSKLTIVGLMIFSASYASADECADLNSGLTTALDNFNAAHSESDGVFSGICGTSNYRQYRSARCVNERRSVGRKVAVAYSDIKEILADLEQSSCRLSRDNRWEINDMGGNGPRIPSIRSYVRTNHPRL